MRYRLPDHSTSRIWLVGVGIGGVVVLALVAYAIVWFRAAGEAQRPYDVALSYCSALRQNDTAAAYALLDANARNGATQGAFAQAQQTRRQIDGGVTGCVVARPGTPSPLSIAQTPSAQMVTLFTTRARTFAGALALRQENGDWKIADVAPGADGSDLGPLYAAEAYCTALRSSDYSAAFGDATGAYQAALGGQQAFTQSMQTLFGGGAVSLQDCSPRLATYAVSAGGTASVDLTLQVRAATTGGSISATQTFHLVLLKQGSTWKIAGQTLRA